jgi:hypothetical protein
MTTPAGSARELLAALRAGGMSQADIARATGVSPRMLRFVQAGQKPGTAYVGALQQLARVGRVDTPPPVRAQRVRAPGGGTRPAPVERQRPAPPTRGHFGTRTTHTGGGRGRVVEVSAPASEGKGRDDARGAVYAAVQSAARGGRRVAFTVDYSDGTRRPLGSKGGYDASTALRRMRATQGKRALAFDPFAWLDAEGDAHAYAVAAGAVITGVHVIVF